MFLSAIPTHGLIGSWYGSASVVRPATTFSFKLFLLKNH